MDGPTHGEDVQTTEGACWTESPFEAGSSGFDSPAFRQPKENDVNCPYCEHCRAELNNEATLAELRFRRRKRYLPYDVEQRIIKLGGVIVPHDGESMDAYLDRLYELAL